MSSPLDPPEGTKRGLARNGARIIKKALDDAEAGQKDARLISLPESCSSLRLVSSESRDVAYLIIREPQTLETRSLFEASKVDDSLPIRPELGEPKHVTRCRI